MTDTQPETPPDEGGQEIPAEVTALLEAMHLEPTAANVANASAHLAGAAQPHPLPASEEQEQELADRPEGAASTGPARVETETGESSEGDSIA